MATTPADLRNRFPEVTNASEYPTSRLQMAIDEAGLIVGLNYGRFQDIATAYLAMHYLWRNSRTAETGVESAGAGVGPQSSKTVGQVSASYAVVPVDPSHPDFGYYGTIYGRQYLDYRRMVLPSAFIVI